MIAVLLFFCLVLQISIAVKIFFTDTNKKLNIYLSILTAIWVISTILEINLYYTTNETTANEIYKIYQCIILIPLIFLTYSVSEYIIMFSEKYSKKLITIIKILVVFSNSFCIILIFFNGASANIFLSAPGKWSINFSSIGTLFLTHTIIQFFWLLVSLIVFFIIGYNSKSKKIKWWFWVLGFMQFLATSGMIFVVFSHNSNSEPGYDLLASIPITIFIFLQVWVLSSLSLFHINSKNLYESFMLAESDSFIVLNDVGTIKFINGVGQRKIGLPINSILQSNINSIVELNLQNGSKQNVWDFLQNAPKNTFVEINIFFKNLKKYYNVQSSFKKIILPDRNEAWLWTIMDTTKIESLRIQQELLEKKSVEVNKAYNDSVLIMNITSHDLKSPLKTIAELAVLIKEEVKIKGQNRADEYLSYISSITDQSLTLTTQMAEYLRVKVVEKKEELCSMQEVIAYIKQRYILKIERNAIIITYTGEDSIYCDKRQITELLANLIDNAIKYHPQNAPEIDITMLETNDKYHFTVRDNGKGIRAEFLSNIFTKYATEDKVLSHSSGLGLYICKSIIESNNGEISVIPNEDNKPGITVLFTISKN